MAEVTDPNILALLNGGAKQPAPVEDPALLAQLNGEQKPYKGAILPFSKGPDGKVHFDSSAGLLGLAKSAFTLPGDVYTGKVDPKSDEGISRATDLAGFITGTPPAQLAGERALFGPKPKMIPERIRVPSATELKAAGSEGYTAARNMGVDYSSDAVRKMAEEGAAELEKQGLRPTQAPQTYDVLYGKNGLAKPPPNSVAPLDGLEAARQSLSGISVDTKATDRDKLAAVQLLKRLDQFTTVPPEGAVVAGPASAAAKVLAEGRANYGAGKRADRLATKEDMAIVRSQAANSGQNLDNSLRQRMGDVVLKDSELAGFNPAEEEAFRAFIEGSGVRNGLRRLSNMLGGGGGLGAVVPAGFGATAGATLGGPIGAAIGTAIPPVAGAVAKALQNRMASKEFDALSEMVRRRSPLFREQQAAAGASSNEAANMALLRALMGVDDQQAVQNYRRDR